jgi:hypothetical protein
MGYMDLVWFLIWVSAYASVHVLDSQTINFAIKAQSMLILQQFAVTAHKIKS